MSPIPFLFTKTISQVIGMFNPKREYFIFPGFINYRFDKVTVSELQTTIQDAYLD